MILKINIRLRKALIACFAALAASCFTLHAYAAENDNFDNQTFEDGSEFTDESYYNSTWVEASLISGQFIGSESEINLSESIFNNANLTSVTMSHVDARGSTFTSTNFTNAQLDFVDFRGANLTSANFTGADMDACDFRGATLTGMSGFSLSHYNNHNNISSGGYLYVNTGSDILIRDIYYASPTAEGLNVKLQTSANMSSSSDLFIEQGGQLEIIGSVTVTLGYSHTTIIEASDTAPTSLLLRSNASLIINEHASIKIVDNTKQHEGASIDFTFLDAEDGTTLTASNLEGVLRYNGVTLRMANLSLVQTGTSYSIVGQLNFNYDNMDLSYADLNGIHFANHTSWNNTILRVAGLQESIFDGVALLGTDFSDSRLWKSQFKGITSATGATFNDANLTDALIDSSNFEGADFSKADFDTAILSQSNFKGANFTSASFIDADLTASDITDAIINGAQFNESLGGTGITHAQLLSTKNGQEKDYSNIFFYGSDLEGFDFSDATLLDVNFNETKLKGAQFEGADISQAQFDNVINSNNMTLDMLASTANAQAKTFSDIDFISAELTGYDFTGYQLRDANFSSSNLDEAIFTGSYIQGCMFFDNINLSQEQLESTASYAERDFSQLFIGGFDFSNFDFSDMNLSQSYLEETNMQGADLSNADLRLSQIYGIQNLDLSTHKNLINTNGEVLNVELNSLDDHLSVRGPVAEGELSDEVYVTLKQGTTISGEATLEVLSGGALKLEGAALTLTPTGNLLINAPNDADSALMLTGGSSLTLESGAFIDIMLAEALFAPGYSFDLLSVDSSSTLLELDALAASLRINGDTLSAAGFELSVSNGIYKLTSYVIPSDGDCIWLGDTSKIWNNTSLNWMDDELPSELASVYLTNEGSGAVELDGTKTVKNIYVQDKNYTISGSELNVGTLSIAEGLILSLENTEVNISSQLDAAKGAITNNTTLTLEGGQAHQLGVINSSTDSKFYLKGDSALLIGQVLGDGLLHIGENAQMTVTGYIYMSTGSITNNGTLTLKEEDVPGYSRLIELNGSGKLIIEDNVALQLETLALDDIKMGENSTISLYSRKAEIEFERFESKGTLTSYGSSHLIFNAAVAVGGSVGASELTITAPSHFNSLATDTLHINTTLSADTVALSVTSLQGKTDSLTLSLGLSGLSEHTTDGSYLILSKEDEAALNLSYTTQLQATLDVILADDRTYSFDWNESLTELSLTISTGDLTTWKTAEDFAAKYNSETGQQFEGTAVVLFADASTGQISSFAAFESVKAIEVDANALIDLGLSGEGVLALNNLSGESDFTLTLKNGAASLNNNKATRLNGNLEAEGIELSLNNSIATELSANKLTLVNSSLHLTADSALRLSYLTAHEQGSIKNEGSLTITESATISALRESTGTLTLAENALVNITGEYDNTGLVTIGSNATLLLGRAFTTQQTIELGDVNNSGMIDAGINLLNITATLTKSGSIKAEHLLIYSDNTFESLNVGTEIQINTDVAVDISQLSTDNESGAELRNFGTLSLDEVSGAFRLTGSGETTILANRQIELQSITQQNIVVEAGATLTLNEFSRVASLSGEGTLISKGALTLYNAGSSIGHLQVDELRLDQLSSTSSFLSTESISSYTKGQSITLEVTSHFSSLGEGSYSIIAAENLSWDMFEWSDFSQRQFDTLVANGRLYEFVESSTGLSMNILLASGVHNLWYSSNNFAAKYNSEGEMYPSTEIPLLGAQGYIVSYAAFDSVDNVYVDASLSLDLSTIDTGVVATDELTLKHLSATEAEVTLSLLGEGKDLDTVLLRNEYNSTMQGKLKADDLSLIVSNGEHIVLSVNELELNDSRLSVSADSQLALGKLEGDGRSVIGGDISIYGEGGAYYGGYENAHVSIVGEDTNQTLLTGDGLHLSGSKGMVTLVAPTHPRVVHSLGSIANTGTGLDLRSLNGSTLNINTASSMDGGTLRLGVSSPVSNISTVFMGASLTLRELNVEVYASSSSVIDEIEARGQGSYTLFDFGSNTTLEDGVELSFMGDLKKYVYSWSLNPDKHSVDVTIRTDFYADIQYSGNGIAGSTLIIDMDENHTASGELEDVMQGVLELIDVQDEAGANKLAAAIAGASVTSLGSAQIGTLESRLQSLRSQDYSQLKEGESHSWIAAEGSFNELSQDATMAGHSLNTWGGSVGAAWGVSEHCQVSASFSALYGDLDAQSVDAASGDMDSYYLAAGVQFKQGVWKHRFAATMGLTDATLARTVSYAGGSYHTEGDTSGFALGLTYELGYEIALDEQKASVIEPLVNFSFVSSSIDGYTEQGSSAALEVGDQENSYFTVAVGARYKQQVNEAFSYSAHALLRFDAGDRQSEADVSFADISGAHATVQGVELDSVGVELGVGASYSLDEQSSLFGSTGIELRGDYSNVNGTVGYRLSF